MIRVLHTMPISSENQDTSNDTGTQSNSPTGDGQHSDMLRSIVLMALKAAPIDALEAAGLRPRALRSGVYDGKKPRNFSVEDAVVRGFVALFEVHFNDHYDSKAVGSFRFSEYQNHMDANRFLLR